MSSARSLGLLGAALLVSACEDDSRDSELAKVTSIVREAEEVCGVAVGSIRVLRSIPGDSSSRIHVIAGCPSSPLYRCLWEFKEARGLSTVELPISLNGCQDGGVE